MAARRKTRPAAEAQAPAPPRPPLRDAEEITRRDCMVAIREKVGTRRNGRKTRIKEKSESNGGKKTFARSISIFVVLFLLFFPPPPLQKKCSSFFLHAFFLFLSSTDHRLSSSSFSVVSFSLPVPFVYSLEYFFSSPYLSILSPPSPPLLLLGNKQRRRRRRRRRCRGCEAALGPEESRDVERRRLVGHDGHAADVRGGRR